jgi:DNA sulfur modification protein DndE
MKYKFSITILLITAIIQSYSILQSQSVDKIKLQKEYLENLPFKMSEIQEPTFQDFTVDIRKYGAIPDGHTLNTKEIADAIDECANKGGGVVLIPAGTWVTGPIELKNNINLHLEQGALLLFSSHLEDYPLIQGLDGSSKKFIVEPPIHGFGLRNIAITGQGIIDGAGEVWRPVKKEKQTNSQWKKLVSSGGVVSDDGKIWWPSTEARDGEMYLKDLDKNITKPTREDYAKAREYLRPNLIQLVKCNGILLDGPTFRNSPRFHVNPMRSENIIIRDINIQTQWYAQNGDGLDLTSCRNVLVYNTTVDAGDDGICIKPAKPRKGDPPSPTCENIVIADCIVYHAHGGFVIGSESDGGARNISVSNCIFIGTDVGLRFKSMRGRGGLIENIYINGIQMRDINDEAILFDLYYSDGDPERQATEGADDKTVAVVTPQTPQFRNFFIRNIVCNGASRPLLINGLPELPVKNIHLDSIYVASEKGALCVDADSIFIQDANFVNSKGAVVLLNQCQNIILNRIVYPDKTELFLNVEGGKSRGIQLHSIDLSRSLNGIQLGKNVATDAVIKK